MSNKNVLAVCAKRGIVNGAFMDSLDQLIIKDGGRRLLGVQNVSGAYIPESRNMLVTEFLKSGAEWMFSVDDDMVFQPDLLDVLLSAADANHRIVGGLYLNYFSDGNPYPVWLEFAPDSRLSTVTRLESDKLMEVAAVGMGGTVIHRSVFVEIAESRAHVRDNWVWYGHDLNAHGERLGEDVTFCLRARACGIVSYGYTKAQMGHMKMRCLDMSAVKDIIVREK